jgi:hypothetical protein
MSWKPKIENRSKLPALPQRHPERPAVDIYEEAKRRL